MTHWTGDRNITLILPAQANTEQKETDIYPCP